MGGPDISTPLSPGSHIDTHPSGEIFLFLVLLLLGFLFGDHVSIWGPWVLGDCTGGAGCLGYGCLEHAVNDATLGLHLNKMNQIYI